jgi:predicted ribosome quality control (RQC) complex YloA/Tae2 family protein
VEQSLETVGKYTGPADLKVLRDILDELNTMGAGVTGSVVPKGESLKANRISGKATRGTNRREQRAQGGAHGPYRSFECPSGYAVLVGRNNRQNDELSLKVARDHDLWLHARQVPGAHVVVRLERNEVASDEDVAFAAGLAVHYSRARDRGKCEVTTCRGKDVSKPRGAPPGMVSVAREVVVMGVTSLVAEVVSTDSS